MFAFLKRRWFWFQVALGLRERPAPITPEIIARAALDLLDRQLVVNPNVTVRAGHVLVHGFGMLPPYIKPD